MRRVSFFGRIGLAAFSLFAGTVSALAFDSYLISVATNVMKGDPDVVFQVTPLQGALPQYSPHNIYISLPSGILENPLADPPNGLDNTSIVNWGLFANNSSVAGNTPLTVTEALAASPVTTTKYFNLQNVVRSFEIVPPASFTGTTGTPFQITIRAKDGLAGAGAVVTGFNDNVLVSALIGDVVVNGAGNLVSGSDFVNGEAVVSVMLRGTDPSTRTNRITVSASINYFSLGVATGYVDVNVNPGSYDHLVMLFPGETLVPGNILITNGKTGSSTAATANVPINQVLVYAVDAFNNPLLSLPGAGVSLDFVSLSHPGTDTVPLGSIPMSSPVQVFSNAISFQVGNVSHQIRVADHNDATKNSVTTISVNSGAANLISVGAVASPRTAGQSFNISARVVDGTPSANTVVSYPSNRPVNVTLTNCSGGGIGAGSLDTNLSLAGVQTTVNFINGVFTGPIVLYPRATTNVCIRFDDGLGNFGDSNGFLIDHGGTPRLHVVMPGQSFTTGQAPGNSPSIPPIQVAGDVITATVYVVDEGWNIWNTVDGGWNANFVVVSLEDDLGNPGYVDLTAADPLMPDSGNNASVTGVRLRTAYPLGNARLVANMGGVSGRSDPFTINPSAYTQMVFVAPGETLASGIQSSIEPDGKTGLPTDQAVNANIPVAVHLTDAYFNTIINPPLAGSTWPSLTFSTTAPAGAIVTYSFSQPVLMTDGDFNNQLVLGTIGANTLRVVDTSPTPKSINQTINVTAGEVTRFLVTPNAASVTTDPIATQTAGVPFNLTFKAFDQYNNEAKNFSGDVYLELWDNGVPLSYGGTISPSTVTFVAHPVTGGYVANVPVTITYAGQALGLGADLLQVRAYVSTPTMRQGFSHEFNVQELATWSDIVITRAGESLRPGLGPPYKTGTPTSVLAGNSFEVIVTAVDSYGNKVNQNGVAELTMETPGVFANLGSPPQVLLSSGRGNKFVQVYTAGSSVIQSSVAANGFTDRSTGTITAGTYSSITGQALLLAPGETVLPGSPSAPGKDSSGILSVVANTAMSYTLLACDRYYNRDLTYTGNPFSLSSDDGAISQTNLAVTAGSGTVSGVYLIGNVPNPSTVRVTAVDQGNSSKTSYSDVPVLAGAYYTVSVPTATTVGSPFSMTVQLIDPNTGSPMAGASNSISLQALTSSGTAASVPIGTAVATLNNGAVTFQQSYGRVEVIKIRVTDSFNRTADSGNIVVEPNGLIYKFTLPSTTVTADDVFPITVGLYDSVQQNVLIQNAAYQHSFNLHVSTTAPGPQAQGIYPVNAATLSNGVANFTFSYTKAETIVIAASGTVAGFPTVSGSAAITIHPGAYVRLQVVPPGETAVPGIPSTTGKVTTGDKTQVAKQGFNVTVFAVDRNWNKVDISPNNPTVRLSASDGSLAGRPMQSFMGGLTSFTNVALNTPPLVTVTADDTSNNNLFPQSVAIPVNGPSYVVTLNSSAPFYSGSPLDFVVTLASGTVTTPYTVSIQPLNAATYEPLDLSDLVVVSPSTASARNVVDFTNPLDLQMIYNVARDVVFKISDADGWQGYSSTISFIPNGVDYELSFPAETQVGPPTTFPMILTPRDKVTGTTAINFSMSVTITPVSPIGTPITGTLQKTTALIDRGAQTFQQAFSQSGVFYFTVSDGVNTTTSTTMNFLPGPLASMSSSLSPVLEAGNTEVVRVTLLDAFNNPIPVTTVTLSLADSSFGTLSPLSGITNEYGWVSSTFTTSSQKSGRGEFRAASGTTRLAQTFRLLGPPTTTLRVEGMGVEDASSYAVKPGDDLYFDLSVDTGLDPVGVTYSIDGGTSTVTLTTFTQLVSGIYSFGPINFSVPGRYTVEYYGVTQSTASLMLHTETARTSKTIYVSAVTTPEEGMVNYPNPFRAGRDLAFLEYHLSADAGVTLTIYDLLGQKVWERSYSQGENGGQSGLNRVSWDGKSSDGVVVGNGGYVAVLEAADGTKLKRKIAVKK